MIRESGTHFRDKIMRRLISWRMFLPIRRFHLIGTCTRAPRRGAHRRKRKRRPLAGMMLHQDGSRHAWLEGLPALDLIVTMDDATSAVFSAFLTEEEGTASTFRGLSETFGGQRPPPRLRTHIQYLTMSASAQTDRNRSAQRS